MTETAGLFKYKQLRRELLTAQNAAQSRYGEAMTEYDILLSQHAEHLALSQPKEAAKLKPQIKTLREEIERLESTIISSGDPELLDLARAALADGTTRLDRCLKQRQELLTDLAKAKETYLDAVKAIGENQREAAGVAAQMAKVNLSLPAGEPKGLISNWPSIHVWEVLIEEDACHKALGFPPVWPIS